jgi:hypothetical protein
MKKIQRNPAAMEWQLLSRAELVSTEGGAIWSLFGKLLRDTIIVDALAHWDDIKQGFSRGWHFADK